MIDTLIGLQRANNEMLAELIRLYKCQYCGNAVGLSQAENTAGANTDVPENLRSVSIVVTDIGGGLSVEMADGTDYVFTTTGEVIWQAAPQGETLPAFVFTNGGGATWSWHGIK